MILDSLTQAETYVPLHPRFAKAFAFLRTRELAALPPGRHPIEGERVYVSIDHAGGRGRERSRLEHHRRYIDIQFTIEGEEQIGWMHLADCRSPDGPFDSSRDIRFYSDLPSTWLTVPPGSFAIFFPDDAHAPLAGSGDVRKAIVKVEV